jgi:uroporphyrin-3 C-methyltransferase
MNDKIDDETNDASEVEVKKKNPLGLLLLVFILSISAIGFSYYNYQSLQGLLSVSTSLQSNRELISSLQSAMQTIDNGQSGFESQLDEYSSTLKLFEQSLSGIYDDLKSDNEDWALAEIEHLIIIASHQLALDADVPTALAAMMAADDRLRGMNNPGLFEVRQQLAGDINKLRSVNHPDIPGMALNVSDLIDRVTQFPLKQETPGLLFENNKQDEVLEGSKWVQFINTIWLELKGLVVISRKNENAIISLLPDQQYYLFQNLRLELDAARLSILQKDTKNLYKSIDLITEWVSLYFDTSDAGVDTIINTLTAMKNVELNPVLPDISSSLESIRAYARSKSNSNRDAQINGVNN